MEKPKKLKTPKTGKDKEHMNAGNGYYVIQRKHAEVEQFLKEQGEVKGEGSEGSFWKVPRVRTARYVREKNLKIAFTAFTFHLTSGYRCEAVNRMVGGVCTSATAASTQVSISILAKKKNAHAVHSA